MNYIYILNYGDYYAKLTAKKIKEQGGRPRIVNFNTPYHELKNPAGFIISGSPGGSIRIPVRLLTKELFCTNYPVMGICIGAQLIARYFGGRYKHLKRYAENGMVEMEVNRRSKIVQGLNKNESVYMLHEDSIVDPGEGFKIIGSTKRCPIAATAHEKWRWYTFQFHPELSGEVGDKIFGNFVKLCYRDEPKFLPNMGDICLSLNKEKVFEAEV